MIAIFSPSKNSCGLKDWGYYCKRFSSILRSIVLTIQKVCWLDFLQVPRGHCGKTLLHHQKRLLSFQNEHLFVFIDKQSTQYHKKHFSLMNETFWTRRLWEWRRSENRWQIVSALCFLVVKSFKSNLKLIKIIKMQTCFTQMVFDSRIHNFNYVTLGILHITERESKNTFELFCEGGLELLKGNRSQ